MRIDKRVYIGLAAASLFAAWCGNPSPPAPPPVEDGPVEGQAAEEDFAEEEAAEEDFGEEEDSRQQPSGGQGPNLAIEPHAGPIGTEHTIYLDGFEPGEDVELYLYYEPTGDLVLNFSTSVDGSGSGAANVYSEPGDAGGVYVVVAEGASGLYAESFLEIEAATSTGNPTLAIDPYTGPVGTEYTIALNGFQPNETVDLYFYYDPTGNEVLSLSTSVDEDGSGIAGVYSEPGDAGGLYVAVAEGRDGSYAEGRFEIEVAPQILDADDDGVPNDRDDCPGTPAGVGVDGDGCELPQTRTLELGVDDFVTMLKRVEPEANHSGAKPSVTMESVGTNQAIAHVKFTAKSDEYTRVEVDLDVSVSGANLSGVVSRFRVFRKRFTCEFDKTLNYPTGRQTYKTCGTLFTSDEEIYDKDFDAVNRNLQSELAAAVPGSVQGFTVSGASLVVTYQ